MTIQESSGPMGPSHTGVRQEVHACVLAGNQFVLMKESSGEQQRTK